MALGSQLHDDHAQLEVLFQDVVDASEANVSSDVLGASWTRLVQAVEAHFEAEEAHLFPAMATSHPDEVSALRAEHAAILRQLGELDLEVDLHVVRHDKLAAIVERLRAHAEREDGTVYEWAEALPKETRRPLSEAIRAILRRKR